MKSLKSILILALFAMFAFSCSSGSKNENDHGHNHNQMTEMMDDASGEKNASGEETGKIANSYLKLKDALVQSNATMSREAADRLRSSLELAELYNEAELAASLANEESLEEQRKIFETLSIRIYELASDRKFEFNTLYKQYCPMAFENKGAFWLSSSKEIRNPYFGDKMLKCGRVEEILAKK